MLDKVRSAPGEPMTMEEINAEIKRRGPNGTRVKLVVDTNALISGSAWTGNGFATGGCAARWRGRAVPLGELLAELAACSNGRNSAPGWSDAGKAQRRSSPASAKVARMIEPAARAAPASLRDRMTSMCSPAPLARLPMRSSRATMTCSCWRSSKASRSSK